MEFTDVAIIGGGPAGLTAASTLARQRHTAVVFDSKSYRNAGAARESDSHFKVRDASGKVWNVRKVILAVGSADSYPNIDGYGSYGRSGFTIACSATAMRMGTTRLQVSSPLPHDEDVAAELKPLVSSLVASKFNVETHQIKHLIGNGLPDSITVEFVDGSIKEEKFLVHNPRTSPQGPFVAQLGLATMPLGDVQAEAPFWQTSAPGVFAVATAADTALAGFVTDAHFKFTEFFNASVPLKPAPSKTKPDKKQHKLVGVLLLIAGPGAVGQVRLETIFGTLALLADDDVAKQRASDRKGKQKEILSGRLVHKLAATSLSTGALGRLKE
ncbi:hypothetical protein DL767_009051 [Monosporascus sp. MG133]|nr:hypothetical protein DL767_009051 [Monosporascus sp. MG133]